eukprot:5391441-Prymnesium_polylepis.1
MSCRNAPPRGARSSLNMPWYDSVRTVKFSAGSSAPMGDVHCTVDDLAYVRPRGAFSYDTMWERRPSMASSHLASSATTIFSMSTAFASSLRHAFSCANSARSSSESRGRSSSFTLSSIRRIVSTKEPLSAAKAWRRVSSISASTCSLRRIGSKTRCTTAGRRACGRSGESGSEYEQPRCSRVICA